MRRKFLVIPVFIVLVSFSLTLTAVCADRDRYTEWSPYYNGVCFRYVTSYLGAEVWSSYPDAVQFYNGRKSTAKIEYKTTVGGPRLLFLEAERMSEKTALARDESITQITATYSEEPAGWNLEGTWRGTGYQANNTSWSMELIVRGNNYTIKYPSLTCSGYWSLTSMGSDSATFTEHITSGRGNCVDNGNVVIRRIDANRIDFYWYDGNPKHTSSAVLTKVD